MFPKGGCHRVGPGEVNQNFMGQVFGTDPVESRMQRPTHPDLEWRAAAPPDGEERRIVKCWHGIPPCDAGRVLHGKRPGQADSFLHPRPGGAAMRLRRNPGSGRHGVEQGDAGSLRHVRGIGPHRRRPYNARHQRQVAQEGKKMDVIG